MTETITPAQQWISGGYTRLNTGSEVAAALRLLADRLDSPTATPGVTLSIRIQPDSHITVDVLAGLMGVEATTIEYPGRTFQRNAELGQYISAFTSCPAPVEVQREILLAQLAELDRQEKAKTEAVAAVAA